MFVVSSQAVQPVYIRTHAARKGLALMAEPVLNVTASTCACAQKIFQETYAKQKKVKNVNNVSICH